MGLFSNLFSSKKTIKPSSPAPTAKPIGSVTHYFGGIDVAIVKFTVPVQQGSTVRFKGATTDFTQKIASMQFDHHDVQTAAKGQEVGIKVKDKVRDGDSVYSA